MILDVLICTIYIFLFTYIVWKSTFFSADGVSKSSFLAVFFLKIIVGIVGWQLYSSVYPINDAIGFYNSSKVLYDLYFENKEQFFKLFFGQEDDSLKPYLAQLKGWEDGYLTLLVNDSRSIIRYNTILQFVSLGTYHVHTIVSCFLSFFGLTFIYKSLLFFIKEKSKLLFVVIFLLPSVLFWSSMVFKESLVFLGLGLVLYHSRFGLRKSYSLSAIFYLLLGLLLMLLIKSYLLFCVLPALFANAIFIRLNKPRIILVYLFLFSFLFFLVIGIHSLFPQHDLVKKLKDKQEIFNKAARGGVYLTANEYYIFVEYNERNDKLVYLSDSTCRLKPNVVFKKFRLNQPDSILIKTEDYSHLYKIAYDSPPAGSYHQTKTLNGSIWQLIAFAPKKILKMFFLTDFFKHKGFLICLSIVENSLLVVCLLFALFYSDFKKEHLPILLFCCSFMASLYFITGFTTPVLGAIVRYKVPAEPFLGVIIVLLYNQHKLKGFLQRFFSKTA
jgi:hypothetical protein